MHDTGWPECTDRRCLNTKALVLFFHKDASTFLMADTSAWLHVWRPVVDSDVWIEVGV